MFKAATTALVLLMAAPAYASDASEAELYTCIETAIIGEAARANGISYETAEAISGDNGELQESIEELVEKIGRAKGLGIPPKRIGDSLYESLPPTLAAYAMVCIYEFYEAD